MPAPTYLYDLLASYWPPAEDQFAAVWAEDLSTVEAATRLGADLTTATPCSLRGIGRGFSNDAERPADADGIILVGECRSWTLAVQVQQLDIVEDRVLSALSRDGGRAIGLYWHVNGGHRIVYAMDGIVVASGNMRYIPAPLEGHAEGVHMPDTDEDDDFSSEEMITTALELAGRVTGERINEDWLYDPQTRYIIRAAGT